MQYQQLRERVKNWEKYPGCVNINRSPLLNPAYPGSFNLSFAEEPWVMKYKRFFDFNHNYHFSTIQSCIRPDDFSLINSPDSWKYLGVFEMADVYGCMSLANKPNYEKLMKIHLKSLIDLLNELGISSNNVYPSYNSGGLVSEITNSKYTFDFQVPEDKISKQAFLEAGIPEQNLIPDKTRDTFLALHVNQPSPWGYRSEICINIGSKSNPRFLDVATTEYTPWKPVFQREYDSKNIVGLEERKDGFILGVVGLERLCMVVNKLPRVQDVDYIKSFYQTYRELVESEDLLAGESLRALHRLCSDVQQFRLKPSRHKKEKINRLIRKINNLNAYHMRELLGVHSQTQPWHDNLEQGIEPTIERIETYRRAGAK